MISLGFEAGTGREVKIPLAHMAVTGQTQQSGKTTTLEALIDRGDLRAVVFVTKPGEKSFGDGNRILPYFTERADWEYVKELLEARLNESLGQKVGYVMRACDGARSLSDVRRNIQKELPKKKSARPSPYEVLAGYLDLIISELARFEYTDKLELRAGVNIMDLSGLTDDMQSLVLRSTIERIHKKERNTVLVLPEAWKFIPEGGRSAVFESLHRLIREGATNRNYVWIDAQDLAVVSKRILKSVSVWILGKQQEANEVARTINHLIEPVHIKPDMIKSLGVGFFLVCDGGPVRHVYVRPRWLGALDATAIAKGEETIETAQRILAQKKRDAAAVERAAGERHAGETVRLSGLGFGDAVREVLAPAKGKAADLCGTSESRSVAAGEAGTQSDGSDDEMYKEKFEAAETQVAQLTAEVNRLRHELDKVMNVALKSGRTRPPMELRPAPSNGEAEGFDLDSIYAEVKRRAVEDPGILRLLATRAELLVKVEPVVLEVKGDTLRGDLAKLLSQGFFTAPRKGNQVFEELRRLGRSMAKANVYRELDGLAGLGFFTKELDGYQSAGLKITVTK